MKQTDFAHVDFSFKEEFGDVNFGDRRLHKRFLKVMENFVNNPNPLIQQSQKSWAEMMAAYRFFDNDKVEKAEILRAHREQTWARMSVFKRVLALQDTSLLCYSSHPSTEGLGSIGMGTHARSARGLFLHSTLATTTSGVPLGFLDQVMWSREHLAEGWETDRDRWLQSLNQLSPGNFVEVVLVTDREGDGSDVYTLAQRAKLKFVIRAKDKLRKSALHKKTLIADVLREEPLQGEMSTKVRVQKIGGKGDSKYRTRHERKAVLNLHFGEVQINKPAPHRSSVTPVGTAEERTLRAVFVEEINPPAGFEPVSWLLFTNLEVTTLEQAKEIVEIYKVRWEIETFHRILKSACGVEKAQLETADRLQRLVTVLSLVAWRLHVLTKLQRESPKLSCEVVLAPQEWQALVIATTKSKKLPPHPPNLKEATLMIAKLGGFIGRKSDGEPGPITLWRGWVKLIQHTEMYVIMNGGLSCV